MQENREPTTWGETLKASRYRLVLAYLGLVLALSLVVRLVLLATSDGLSRAGLGTVVATLLVGEAFDLAAALWLAVPFMLYLLLLPQRWFARRWQRGVVLLGFVVAAFGTVFIALAELFFFDEFNGRFNFVAVDYLMFPTEVVTNIWESYHTGLWLALIALATLAGLWFAWPRQLRQAWQRPLGWRRRGLVSLGFAALVALVTVAVSPSLAHVSEDRELNEIAGNGYYSFWMALLGRDAPYAGWYASASDGELAGRLPRLLGMPGGPVVRPASTASETPALLGWSTRDVKAAVPARRLNVVIVLEESLGAEFVGALKPGIDSCTPRLDALSQEGTLLTHAYSTGNRTIRALEATTTSLPPLPGISLVRREASKNLFTLPSVLKERGYQTLFVYGGRALFDNMGAYLTANGIDRVVDQSDYPADTFRTAWGVADEAIFDRALVEMDGLEAAGKPFYTLVLSVSNHRPFLFPEGRIEPEAKYHRRGNAVRYADYALGRFIEQARQHAFFDHTLFVLMGDHGARVYGAAEIPLASYEVPILFYAPGIVPAGQRLDTIASSLDVPPTVLALLGMSYRSKFFGRDVFHLDPADGRALMTHNNEVALLKGDRMAVLGLHESADLFAYRAADDSLERIAEPDAAGRELIRDAVTYYAAADRLYRSGSYQFDDTGAVQASALADGSAKAPGHTGG